MNTMANSVQIHRR